MASRSGGCEVQWCPPIAIGKVDVLSGQQSLGGAAIAVASGVMQWRTPEFIGMGHLLSAPSVTAVARVVFEVEVLGVRADVVVELLLVHILALRFGK